MRIISKSNDFIDSIQAHGLDENVVYVRKTDSELYSDEVFDDPFFRKLNKRFDKLNDFIKINNKQHRCILFGFCGKVYPMIEIPYNQYKFEPLVSRYVREIPTNYKFVTTTDEIVEIYKKHRYEDERVSFLDKKSRKHFSKKHLDPVLNDLYGDDSFGWLFTELNVPVFVLEFNKYTTRDVMLITNPLLKSYDFGKIMDAYTAFQEISMYISGVLGVGSNNIVDISDVHMRDAKGFNNSSFKTRKGTKKPRRKK